MADESNKMKMAVIAGAAHALKVKNKEKFISDHEILQKVTEETDKILENIDLEE